MKQIIKKGYICLTDWELKRIDKENVFVILSEKHARSHKRFYEKNYNTHQNLLSIEVKLKGDKK